MKKVSIEKITKQVYGETFALYNKGELLKFIEPLKIRLKRNGISESVFKGKNCLDAGCGGGRGSLLMALAGASKVTGYDISEQNVETTIRNARLFHLKNVYGQVGSLEKIPYTEGHFDIVWCNGVIHHTANPDRVLCEVTRVLKKGEYLWLYLYGSGGIYWCLIDFLRDWLNRTDINSAMAFLKILGTPVPHIAEFIDDWYVPLLRKYTHGDVAVRLKDLGFSNPVRLLGGMAYDTSMHRARNLKWVGEGDLRYWVKKTTSSRAISKHRLPSRNIGSFFADAKEICDIREKLKMIAALMRKNDELSPHVREVSRIVVASRLQTDLRNILSKEKYLNQYIVSSWLDSVVKDISQATKFKTDL